MNKPRVYGAWAGNPAGYKEDVSRCIESVCGNARGDMPHQCDRKRGHGEGGLYCKQHDPKAVAAKRAAATAKYEAYWAARSKESDLAERRKEAVEAAIAYVQVFEHQPIMCDSETGRALIEAVKPFRVS